MVFGPGYLYTFLSIHIEDEAQPGITRETPKKQMVSIT